MVEKFDIKSIPNSVGRTADALTFAQLLTVTRLDTVWGRDLRLDAGPSLPARIRGAWGQRLYDRSKHDPEAARAWSAFFPDKVVGAGEAPMAPPYRIAAWQDNQLNIHVSLRLIGFSGSWRRVAFETLISALQEPPGLRLEFGSAPMATLTLLDAVWTRAEGVNVPTRPSNLVLDFRSPLRIGNDSFLSTDFGNVIVSIAQRSYNISPWIGIEFTADLSLWRDIAKGTVFKDDGLRPVAWETWSTANGLDRGVGYMGRLLVVAPTDEVTALLAAGTIVHAGGRPSKGYGRYELNVEP